MQKLVAAFAALAALVVPAVARAGDVAMRVQDVPLAGRVLASASPAMNFNMLAAHWAGSGAVLYRTHRLHGRWSRWTAFDADVAPDGGTGPVHDGNLEWTGASDAFQFRRSGDVRDVRAFELWARVTAKPSRRLSEAGSPTIVPRSGWGADEKIVRAKPVVAAADRLAVVHHTAGTNTYSPAQSAAIVRGIETYHVKGNGWNDIGYNFLVDRFGTVYEGRRGGIDRNIVGAHAEGFNTGTFGVALIGNFSVAKPPPAMQSALVDLLAWRLDVAHVDPLSTVVYTSGGNLKYRAGKVVTLRAISGHRDTGPSECPGTKAYVLLPAIAKRVAATGLPKLYSPTVSGALGGAVRFQARLSAPAPWTVTVVDRLGKTVAHGAGHGALVDWTWSSLVAGKGVFTWTIAAPDTLAATGTLGVGRPVPPGPVLSLTNVVATPAVVTPAADGSGDVATVSFTLGNPANVVAQVLDASGEVLLNLVGERREAGANSFQLAAAVLPDGRYRIVVSAKALTGAKVVTKTLDLVVDRTLSGLQAQPAAISPNGDGVADSTTLSFTLTQSVPVRLDIVSGGIVAASPFAGTLGPGQHSLVWDGAGFGAPLYDGTYQAVLTVTDQLGEVRLTLPLVLDTTAPKLALVDAHKLRFTLDEPATVTVLVNQQTQIVRSEPKGTFTVPFTGPVTQVTATAQDAAGNVSAAVSG